MATLESSLEESFHSDSENSCGGDDHEHDKDNGNGGGSTRYSDRNLIINYIPSSLTDQQLLILFSRVGLVKNCRIIRDKHTLQSFGFGFCEYESAQHAQEAIQLFNGHKLGGKTLKVAFARLPGQESKNCNLFIQNLPASVTQEELYRVFGRFGRIVQCRLISDSQGRSRRIGFVLYENRSCASAARETLNDRVWPGLLNGESNKEHPDNQTPSGQGVGDLENAPEQICDDAGQAIDIGKSETSPCIGKESNLVKVQFAAENTKKCRSILAATSNGVSHSPNGGQPATRPASETRSSPSGGNLLASLNALSVGGGGRFISPVVPSPWCGVGINPTAAISILSSPVTGALPPYSIWPNAAPTLLPFSFNAPFNLSPASVAAKMGASATYRPPLLAASAAGSPFHQMAGIPLHTGTASTAGLSQPFVFPANPLSLGGAHTNTNANFLSFRSAPGVPHTANITHTAHFPGSAGGAGRILPHAPQLSPPTEAPFVLYIYNIGNNMTEEGLRELFKPFGNPRKVDVPPESGGGVAGGVRSKNYGFVTYDNMESALAALKGLNGLVLEGRQLQVSFRKEKNHPASTSTGTTPSFSTSGVIQRSPKEALLLHAAATTSSV